jgi:hypothetical protein
MTPGKFVVVNDYIEKVFFPTVVSMREYFPYRSLINKLNTEIGHEILEKLGADHTFDEEEIVLISSDGPALPSN